MARRKLACAHALPVLWSVAVVVPAGGVAGQLRPGDILYVEETTSLYRITPGSERNEFFAGIGGQNSSISDVATGPGGAIYLSVNYSFPRPADLFRVDPVSGAESLVTTIPRLGESRGLAVERAGTVLMAHNTDLLRIDPVTGGNTVVSSGGLLSASLRDVEVGPDGTVYVGLASEDVVRIDPVTGAQSRVVLGQVAGFGYFTVAPDGNLYYPRRVGTPGGVDPVRSQVVRHDLATGTSTVIYDAPSTFEDFGFIVDLVVDPAGDILGTDAGQPILRPSDGRIVKFDRDTGERSIVLFDPRLPGLANPTFIAVFVPEPGAAGVCVAVGGVLLMRRRRGPTAA